MAAPTIDTLSSIISFPQWLSWEHQFSATGSPYDWAIAAGAFPTGMTFQPAWSATGDNGTDAFTSTGHGLADGTALVIRSKSGGSGLALNTVYFVINADTDIFQLALTPGGAAVDLGSTVTAATLYRPGLLTGAASLPGVRDVRLVATNGDGASAEALFAVAIVPAAAVPDSNADLVWNFATNDIIAQTDSTLDLKPLDRDVPILFVKEGDDLILRLRTLKAGSVLDLGALADPADLKLVLKELEPETQVAVSDDAARVGAGDSASYLLHNKFDGAALAESLENYEADAGTYYDALAEIEITFANPVVASVGPSTLRRTSKTFRIRIERDLGEGL